MSKLFPNAAGGDDEDMFPANPGYHALAAKHRSRSLADTSRARAAPTSATSLATRASRSRLLAAALALASPACSARPARPPSRRRVLLPVPRRRLRRRRVAARPMRLRYCTTRPSISSCSTSAADRWQIDGRSMTIACVCACVRVHVCAQQQGERAVPAAGSRGRGGAGQQGGAQVPGLPVLHQDQAHLHDRHHRLVRHHGTLLASACC